MPKVSMIFKLPEEQGEFDAALNGIKNEIIIESMFAFIRQKLKYEELTDEQVTVYEEVRQKLADLVNEE